MNNSVKILVAAPTFSEKDYCTLKYLQAIKKLDYDNYDHIMVDNSKPGNEKYLKRLKNLGIKAFHVPRGKNSREAISNSMNFIRDYFLKGDYNYLLIVESDLFPRPDTIKRLLSYNERVVGSYYLIGHEEDDDKYYKPRDLFRKHLISKKEFDELTIGLQPRRACLFRLDMKPSGSLGTLNLPPDDGFKMFGTGLRQIHGCGLGCTLIRREIIERFPFWTDKRFSNKHSDVYFYLKLENSDIPVFVDTDVLVEHQPSRWDSVDDM